jgi:hypothetical protein
MPLACLTDLPLGKATTEKFFQRSDKVYRTFDRSLVDTEACLGECVLLVEAEGQQTDPQSSKQ